MTNNLFLLHHTSIEVFSLNMNKIILKSLDKQIINHFTNLLKNYSQIHFCTKKINGEYRIVIFCQASMNLPAQERLLQNYIYYYTTVSLLLCDVIVDLFEEKIVSYYLQKKEAVLQPKYLQKAKNISSMILDANFPSSHAKSLYLYKKNLILGDLLLLFKKQNYLTIEAIALFALPDYHDFLEKVAFTSFHFISENIFEEDFINFILNNFFK